MFSFAGIFVLMVLLCKPDFAGLQDKQAIRRMAAVDQHLAFFEKKRLTSMDQLIPMSRKFFRQSLDHLRYLTIEQADLVGNDFTQVTI